MNMKEDNKENTQTKRSKRITMKKLKKNVKGITLIALVVTIIVLLILAGVALNLTIGQNGIFSRAQTAANTWKNAEANEQLALGEGADIIDQYLNGNGSGNDNPDNVVGTSLGVITGNETSNTTTKDKYGNSITIPAGFKVVNPDDDVTKGIVIEDVSANGEDSTTIGSQFVWIPVGDVYISSEHTEENKKTITLGRYTFSSDGTPTPVQTAENWSQRVEIPPYYTEFATNSGNASAKSLENFVTMTLSRGGYYIGRYEAGDATAEDSSRTSSTRDENPVVCKVGIYPYNDVTQLQASSLARGMYTSSNFESDLMNSYAWDTAIVFIQTFSGDTNYSRQKGKNTTSSLQKCGDSILNASYVDEGDEAQDVRCNIYDMAGNTYEWTTEYSSFSDDPCVYRGGYYNTSSNYTSDRDSGSSTTYSDEYTSFRPTLYL